MLTQRTTEWTEMTDKDLIYFQQQFEKPYRSTVSFCNWLEKMGCLNTSAACRIADIGSGMGETLSYMGKRFPKAEFTGVELNENRVKRGNRILRQLGMGNVVLVTGDLFQLGQEHHNRYDGILSIQTLSWLPEFKTPLEMMMGLQPKWIALTSLFFEGDVNAKIEIQDYTTPVRGKPCRECFYNVYSIPLVKRLFLENGFDEFHYESFQIDIDLPKPSSGGMGTYTVRLETGERLQISGPVLMNWYFILARSRFGSAQK